MQKLMSDREETLFVDVILPLPLASLFTYRVPRVLSANINIGQRVIVQFGKRKLMTGLVRNLHFQAPKGYEAKYIHEVIDQFPIVNQFQFKLWDWIADYYLSSKGEVMTVALPSGLKLLSHTKVTLNPEVTIDKNCLNDLEFQVIDALEIQGILAIEDLGLIVGDEKIYPLLKRLLEQKCILMYEALTQKYKPKHVQLLRLNPSFEDQEKLKLLIDSYEKKGGKAIQVILTCLQLQHKLTKNEFKEGWINKSQLVKACEKADYAIKSLTKAGVLEQELVEVSRLPFFSNEMNEPNPLNEMQEEAFNQINTLHLTKDVVLLHGVTSSGKTEVYIHLIQEALNKNKQILYLLPEIALTTQIIVRLVQVFGNKVGVYHSKFNENERVEIWNNLIQGNTIQLIIGARSALFLPFDKLGLIIVDEEHDSSFKQFNPGPRYNARDCAIVLAKMHDAKVVLGTATPAIESFQNAQINKFGYVKMSHRFGGVLLPEIKVVNIKEAIKKKLMKSHFSPELMKGMEESFLNGEQIILFQNRRGFAPMLECDACGWTPRCNHCDVSLTYHKTITKLRCHYCGFSRNLPSTCEACGNAYIKTKGFGTEKIEEDLSVYFPDVKVQRMDLDTTRGKNAYKEIISDFEARKINVLVGTQMVTKGLNFDNVGLVGILNADSMLNFPDFRAFEKSYQLMAQVSGRAGRKSKQGKVIIQTYNPEHNIIKHIIANDYNGMYQNEILTRKEFHYPPFSRMIEITFKHTNVELVNAVSKFAGDWLKKLLGERVIGPEFPMVPRIKNEYLKTICLKVEKEYSIGTVKLNLQRLQKIIQISKEYRSVRIIFNVDPL